MTAIAWIYPVEYQITRAGMITGVILAWGGALLLWWRRKVVRFLLIILAALPALAVCLPSRDLNPELLKADYCRGLRCFRGVRYVWGGEGLLGVDCSGLVRKGLVWGELLHGLRTFNGAPIREAIALWWQDSSAMALRDGYKGWTTEIFRHDSIETADHTRLSPGDLAVTADGVHVLAYLGPIDIHYCTTQGVMLIGADGQAIRVNRSAV